MEPRALPVIIQGGMGIAVSDWRLARAVSRLGQLGVVSGTAIDSVFVRRLQDGDPHGDVRRAMEAFPLPGVAEQVLAKFFLPGGRPPGTPYSLLPLYRQTVDRAREALTVLAAFVEVYLAREGHDGLVGINLLTKIQFPNLPLLYGAMLAGVDFVLMGAGIPREIPGAIDQLVEHQPASLRLEVAGTPADTPDLLQFDPARALGRRASRPGAAQVRADRGQQLPRDHARAEGRRQDRRLHRRAANRRGAQCPAARRPVVQ